MIYKPNKKTLYLLLCLFLICSFSFAHSGRTDSSGGHRDNKNVSGLGSYHYHCGGNPAHLHLNGVCPYSSPTKKTTYTYSLPAPTPAPTLSINNNILVQPVAYPVTINGKDISTFSSAWKPFNYNSITYIPMTSSVINEIGYTATFNQIDGFRLNKATTQSDNQKAKFMDDYIVIVPNNNTNIYHKYGCIYLSLDDFWAYNIDNAKALGFTPCSKCCNQ